MRLTQRQLALLARVSAPTISRFEQAAKDIQLSSVLAILEALGMTDRRTLEFPEPDPRFDGPDLIFWGQDGETRVRFCLTVEALRFHFSDGDRVDRDAFNKHRQDIEALARRKYLLGQREPGGNETVLITDADVT